MRVDVKDNRVRLYRVINGNRVRFGGQDDLPLKLGIWYRLRIEHLDDRIKLYLNDDIVAIEKDRHFPNAGKVGFWTKEDSKVYFDDLSVRFHRPAR